jgi:hypothetical protein
MRRPQYGGFGMAGAAVIVMSFARLARLLKLTSHRAEAEAPDVNRVADSRTNSPRAFWAQSTAASSRQRNFGTVPEVALILRTATILQDAGVTSPPTCADLARRGLSRLN